MSFISDSKGGLSVCSCVIDPSPHLITGVKVWEVGVQRFWGPSEQDGWETPERSSGNTQ